MLKTRMTRRIFAIFSREFPDGANAANAQIKLEQTSWDSVKDSKDKAKIQSYLTNFRRERTHF